MGRFEELYENMKYVYEEEGVSEVSKRLLIHGANFVNSIATSNQNKSVNSDFVDVIFINGCDYSVPHPIRYRVDHQAEQLRAAGLSTKVVNAWELNEDYARLASTFIVFRCPYADVVGNFIRLVHSLNKKVYFDIDDLVIDTVYTDTIPFVASMTGSDREQYDDGVRRMGKTLSLCDGAITTTEQLAKELAKFTSEVFVNRNVASEEMLYFSERALYERDVLPKLELNEIDSGDKHRWKVAKQRASKRTGFSIGYFSGSITHNDDFEMILPAVAGFMANHIDVVLHVVGELDVPELLKPYESRIVKLPFSPWRHLPKMISTVDVNLIPLRDTIFNRAKSENKWVEAALVKVPSISSKVGALADSIDDGVDGILCETVDEWADELESLYSNAGRRSQIANAAYATCRSKHVTTSSFVGLADFIRGHKPCSVAFVLPGMTISGGILVAVKHAELLQRRGYDVTIISPEPFEKKDRDVVPWLNHPDGRLPVLFCKDSVLKGRFDKMVATMWSTVGFIKHYLNAGSRYYLVQNYETDFYVADAPERFDCSATYGYNPDLTYCTISEWCADWLRERYDKSDVRFARNGLDAAIFPSTTRDWTGKIRILIEGDSSSEYKNVDESFRIVDLLPKDRFEIWYLSYKGEPKKWYRVDNYLKAVPHDEVGKVYGQCHILLKTSLLESFSYPPLEMMATGGAAVVLRNGGNAEFLEDGVNSLLFDQGEDEKAARLIWSVVEDDALRERLMVNGLKTAASRNWSLLEDEIVELYK